MNSNEVFKITPRKVGVSWPTALLFIVTIFATAALSIFGMVYFNQLNKTKSETLVLIPSDEKINSITKIMQNPSFIDATITINGIITKIDKQNVTIALTDSAVIVTLDTSTKIIHIQQDLTGRPNYQALSVNNLAVGLRATVTLYINKDLDLHASSIAL